MPRVFAIHQKCNVRQFVVSCVYILNVSNHTADREYFCITLEGIPRVEPFLYRCCRLFLLSASSAIKRFKSSSYSIIELFGSAYRFKRKTLLQHCSSNDMLRSPYCNVERILHNVIQPATPSTNIFSTSRQLRRRSWRCGCLAMTSFPVPSPPYYRCSSTDVNEAYCR